MSLLKFTVVSALVTLPFVALGLMAVWTGDARWGYTAMILAGAVAFVSTALFIAWDEKSRRADSRAHRARGRAEEATP